MEMYCGIDLHATNSWLCVVDRAGQPQLEVRVPNRLEAVLARLEPYREHLCTPFLNSENRYAEHNLALLRSRSAGRVPG